MDFVKFSLHLLCRTPLEECLYNNDYVTYSCVRLKKWLNIIFKKYCDVNIGRFLKVCLTNAFIVIYEKDKRL